MISNVQYLGINRTQDQIRLIFYFDWPARAGTGCRATQEK